MSIESAANFIIEIGANPLLKSQLEKFETTEELITFAREQGYHFSIAEIEQAKLAFTNDELSEDQLDTISGGWGSTLLKVVNVGIKVYNNRGKFEEGLTYLQNKLDKKLGH